MMLVRRISLEDVERKSFACLYFVLIQGFKIKIIIIIIDIEDLFFIYYYNLFISFK